MGHIITAPGHIKKVRRTSSASACTMAWSMVERPVVIMSMSMVPARPWSGASSSRGGVTGRGGLARYIYIVSCGSSLERLERLII